MKDTLYQLGDVNEANIQQFRTLNLKTLPVKYSDKFYNELIANYSTEYLKYAFFNGFVVGSVCARLEPITTYAAATSGFAEEDLPAPSDGLAKKKKLYIMVINVLEPYRRMGVASALLKHVLDKAQKDPDIQEAYLHVQTSNAEAKTFYLSHQFTEVDVISNYYKNIEPPDCFLLRRSLAVSNEKTATETVTVTETETTTEKEKKETETAS